MITASRDRPLRTPCPEAKLIDSVSQDAPAALTEVVTLGLTLKKRADDVLDYFERPGTSNGRTAAINGRLGHLSAQPLGSATSPTTLPGRCSNSKASELDMPCTVKSCLCLETVEQIGEASDEMPEALDPPNSEQTASDTASSAYQMGGVAE